MLLPTPLEDKDAFNEREIKNSLGSPMQMESRKAALAELSEFTSEHRLVDS